jgi:hypothetical protein
MALLAVQTPIRLGLTRGSHVLGINREQTLQGVSLFLGTFFLFSFFADFFQSSLLSPCSSAFFKYLEFL